MSVGCGGSTGKKVDPYKTLIPTGEHEFAAGRPEKRSTPTKLASMSLLRALHLHAADHLFRAHPGVELFFGQVTQLQR